MESVTYPTALLYLQDALTLADESAIRRAVGQCLLSMEVVAYPILAGGIYLMAGHFFLQRKQYTDARGFYQAGHLVYRDALALDVPDAGWLCVQAMLCEAQSFKPGWKTTTCVADLAKHTSLCGHAAGAIAIAVEVAIRLAEGYFADGQRRQAVLLYEEAITQLEVLPEPLCPLPLVHLVRKSYLPLLDTAPLRRQLQVRVEHLLNRTELPVQVE